MSCTARVNLAHECIHNSQPDRPWDNEHISGKVLVYRNPGLHFGDIHVLKATYVKALEDFVGNAKYAIFFPCKGPQSLADEIAGGDFNNDMYFVSRNPEVSIFLLSNGSVGMITM
ncbi:RNA-dependent RNA polymerase, putative [Ricinus communis]|uniref:RNA-dependent RNA polymerase n=1 Tax=Ricinus communis TaxID=3988 RepID=B9RKI7_RICCO|nr:RNA-dependent RNA polymerase, putative [Ricinus communis]